MRSETFLEPTGGIVFRYNPGSTHEDERKGGIVRSFAVVGEEAGFNLHGVGDC